LTFRYDINGLRAIAVVLFHFDENLLSGGFAGVDVFFVLSGYLMTSIIINGFEKNNFNVLHFYAARAKRILPALLILCFTILLFGWFLLTPLDYAVLAKNSAASVSFTSNIVYWLEAGYFDGSSKEKWLLHTWSLSAEWQFYLLYPLFLLVLKKISAAKIYDIGYCLSSLYVLFCVFILHLFNLVRLIIFYPRGHGRC
jgi:peptidoglycan/LPS O-acetylase OafA/YrhL